MICGIMDLGKVGGKRKRGGRGRGGHSYRCDDGVTTMSYDEILDAGRSSLIDSVAADEVRREMMLHGVI